MFWWQWQERFTARLKHLQKAAGKVLFLGVCRGLIQQPALTRCHPVLGQGYGCAGSTAGAFRLGFWITGHLQDFRVNSACHILLLFIDGCKEPCLKKKKKPKQTGEQKRVWISQPVPGKPAKAPAN